MKLKQGIIALTFSLMVVWSNGQTSNIVRTYRQTDTCLFLQVLPYNVLGFTDSIQKLYLLDKFKCIKSETLTLKPASPDNNEIFTWLSFPRLQTGYTSVQSVLGGDNIEPNNYKKYSQLENLTFGSDNPEQNTYNGTIWDNSGYLTYINSTLGYKLTLKYNTNPNQTIKLYLHGTVVDPTVSVAHLYGSDKENWIGYWLYDEQDIFDALGSTANQVNTIKAQDWTCVKTDIAYGAGDPAPYPPFWSCDHKNHTVKYGDMVILQGENDIFNFQWTVNGNLPAVRVDLNPQYYSYQEKADYTPVVVLLDSADHPLEIGVFENDTCIGANVVSDSDSVVVVRSYTDSYSSDSLTFEKYYGTKSTQKNRISNYYVQNRQTKLFEKRKIAASEKAGFFVVSFRKPKNSTLLTNTSSFSVWPNPAFTTLFMEYALSDDGKVSVEVFNTEGKLIAVPVNGFKKSGTYQSTWNLTDFSGAKIKEGLYLIKITDSKGVAVKKILIY